MSTLRVSNIEAKADPSSPSVDEKLKVTNSNGDVLVHIDGKTAGITTVGINTTDSSFTVDAAQNIKFIGIVTATKFSLSGGGEITGGDGNFTGIVTAGSIDATSASFSGNVSIGGTLTYEDVTSIDSIGIVTAQSDVHVGAGLSVVGISTLANTNINGQLTATNARITGVTTFGTSSITINGAHEYPSIRPTLDLNFAATKTLDRRITFTRDSLGTFTDDMGIVRYASNNVPRFDHDPTTGESLGLLIEESRTNTITRSEDWTVSWTDFDVTDTANAAVAPDGTTNATKIVASNSNAEHYTQFSSLTSSINTYYTYSVFCKSAELSSAAINVSASRLYATFNLATGTIITSNSNGTDFNNHSATITSYPNGWFRLTLTGQSLRNTSSEYVRVGLSNNSTNTLNSGGTWQGDGTSGLYFWGAQYEQGAFATSYIPTSGSTVTRAQDTAKITGTNLTDFYNQPEGTIFADYKVIQSEPEIMYLSDNTSSKRIGLYEAGSNQTRFLIGNSGTQADTTSAATTVGDNIKAAGAYKLNDIVAAKNGVISSTDSSATIPDGIDRAYIGGYFNGTAEGVLGLRRLSYYNKRLPNAQLQGLTAQ